MKLVGSALYQQGGRLSCVFSQVLHWPACLEDREANEGEGSTGQRHRYFRLLCPMKCMLFFLIFELTGCTIFSNMKLESTVCNGPGWT